MLVQLFCLADSKEFTDSVMHEMALEVQKSSGEEGSVPVSYPYFLLLNRYDILSDELLSACAEKVVGNAYYALQALGACRFIKLNPHWRKLAIETVSKEPKYARLLLQRQGLMSSDDEYDLLIASVCTNPKQSYKLLYNASGFLHISSLVKLFNAVFAGLDSSYMRQLLTRYPIELEETGAGVQLLDKILASGLDNIRYFLTFHAGKLSNKYVDLILSKVFVDGNTSLARVLVATYRRHLSKNQINKLVTYLEEIDRHENENSWE